MPSFDEEKLRIDQASLDLERSFAKKWAPILTSALISLMVGLGSLAISLEDASRANREERQKETLALVDYLVKYYVDPQYANLSADQRKTVLAVLSSSFKKWPAETTKAVVSQVVAGVGANANYAQDQRYATLAVLPATAAPAATASSAGATQRGSYKIYIQFKDPNDRALVQQIADKLGALGWQMQGIQLVTQATNGDIRYYLKSEADDAKALAGDSANAMRASGVSMPPDLKPIDISRTFKNLPAGVMEIWFPSLHAG